MHISQILISCAEPSTIKITLRIIGVLDFQGALIKTLNEKTARY
jgi:hypothetical protein